MEIRSLSASEIRPEWLRTFRHEQTIRKKWVRANGAWQLADTEETCTWDAPKREWVCGYMRQHVENSGAVLGAFSGDKLIGFACVEGALQGVNSQYANLTMLFVDDAWQGQGVGKALFARACEQAARLGAHKLYISAIPSADTVGFYRAMGCVEASEIVEAFVDTPEDYPLEARLNCAL